MRIGYAKTLGTIGIQRWQGAKWETTSSEDDQYTILIRG